MNSSSKWNSLTNEEILNEFDLTDSHKRIGLTGSISTAAFSANLRSIHVNSNVYIFKPSITLSSTSSTMEVADKLKTTSATVWNVYELYSLNATNWQLNSIKLTEIGNKVKSRNNFHKIKIRATAPVSIS